MQNESAKEASGRRPAERSGYKPLIAHTKVKYYCPTKREQPTSWFDEKNQGIQIANIPKDNFKSSNPALFFQLIGASVIRKLRSIL